jgi:hypothetical protein
LQEETEFLIIEQQGYVNAGGGVPISFYPEKSQAIAEAGVERCHRAVPGAVQFRIPKPKNEE